MSELITLLTIAQKDLRQELRSKVVTVATVFFSAIVLVILAFAIGPERIFLENAAAGVLWVSLAFAGIISSAQSFQAELDEGAFEQLLLFPIPRETIYLGKLLFNWLFLSVLALLVLPTTMLLFSVSLGKDWPWLLLTVLLGCLGFSLISTFYAALTANLRARESLLPVLMFPVIVPVLLAAVQASDLLFKIAVLPPSEIALAPDKLQQAKDWLKFLAGFDLIYFVLCTAIFRFAVEE